MISKPTGTHSDTKRLYANTRNIYHHKSIMHAYMINYLYQLQNQYYMSEEADHLFRESNKNNRLRCVFLDYICHYMYVAHGYSMIRKVFN